MKKFIPAVIACVLAVSLSISVFADYEQKNEDSLNYLLLGDSIARGAGVLNPDEACFGLMVANTNGYNYSNHGIDGYTSAKLLKLINTDDVLDDIRKADIISLSIGGNDFLTSNLLKLLIGCYMTNDDSEFLKIQSEFRKNFSEIIGKIKAENPDALILVQTVYNMRDDFLKGVNQKASDMLNQVFREYLASNESAYVIIDVASVLDGRNECLAFDTIHPNSEGNIEIARLILKALKEKGLCEITEPVILIEPIETSGFGFSYWISVIKYFYHYWFG